MSGKKSEDDQRLDELLLRLLRTPPQPRAERKRPRAKSGQKLNQKKVGLRLTTRTKDGSYPDM
jgi:hypothetical protein